MASAPPSTVRTQGVVTVQSGGGERTRSAPGNVGMRDIEAARAETAKGGRAVGGSLR